MRLVADSGLWTVGPPTSGGPEAAVLEVSGAVLEWTVDDPAEAAATRITFTDVVAADWLWRVLQPAGHTALVAALPGRPVAGYLDLSEVHLLPEVLAPLRRLAVGYWLRRWWPESSRDGIMPLDHALLDCELAILVSAAQEYFTDDTFDSDVDALLAPHQAALAGLGRSGDPRIVALVQRGTDLAHDAGVWPDELAEPDVDAPTARRSDYALAAGRPGGPAPGAVARGVDSVNWAAVPPGIFDAADGTVEWSVETADAAVLTLVHVATTGERSASGIEVRLHCGAITGAGVLDANGTAALELVGPAGALLTETQAWDQDWTTAVIAVGAGGSAVDSSAAQRIRQRVRTLARRRLADPGDDAFLAEILAAESDY